MLKDMVKVAMRDKTAKLNPRAVPVMPTKNASSFAICSSSFAGSNVASPAMWKRFRVRSRKKSGASYPFSSGDHYLPLAGRRRYPQGSGAPWPPPLPPRVKTEEDALRPQLDNGLGTLDSV